MGGLGNRLFQYYEGLRCYDNPVFISYLIKKNIVTKLLNWRIRNISVFDEGFKENTIDGSFFLFFLQYSSYKLFSTNSYFEYFQPLIYEKKILDQLKKKILKNLNPNIMPEKSILHYRGDDTVWSKSHDKSLLNICNLIKPNLIVTDDLYNAKKLFGEKFKIESNSIDEDFTLMLKCETLILSVSSLSWWAMHLSDSIKKVYVPKNLVNLLGVYRNDIQIEIF